ncbi:MAG: hypothetical protein JXL85_09370, partial [Bacilli bacterium]|nr:hypothetical protein [Bacilli bacterium]
MCTAGQPERSTDKNMKTRKIIIRAIIIGIIIVLGIIITPPLMYVISVSTEIRATHSTITKADHDQVLADCRYLMKNRSKLKTKRKDMNMGDDITFIDLWDGSASQDIPKSIADLDPINLSIQDNEVKIIFYGGHLGLPPFLDHGASFFKWNLRFHFMPAGGQR